MLLLLVFLMSAAKLRGGAFASKLRRRSALCRVALISLPLAIINNTASPPLACVTRMH
jgi:hypothetical protein